MSVAEFSCPEAKMGRLKSFGLAEPWQVAFLLPLSWDDFTYVERDFTRPRNIDALCSVEGTLIRAPQVHFQPGAPPRLSGVLEDAQAARLNFAIFGDTRDVEKELSRRVGDSMVLFGPLRWFNDRLSMTNPEILDPRWVGSLRPVYPGKPKVIRPALVRERIRALLPSAIDPASDWLATQLHSFGSPGRLCAFAGAPGWTLPNLLRCAHYPSSVEQGRFAQAALERLASLGLIQSARGNHPTRTRTPLPLPSMRHRAQSLPFALTEEQKQAAAEIWSDLRGHRPMRRVLAGDTGTGKTAVFSVVTATLADIGGTAILLFPNDTLAHQVYSDMVTWWPDLDIQFVVGSTKEPPSSAILVGTTAILHRVNVPPDLLVVDEQQKFARAQREAVMGDQTHLLEVTATCIPRTQALLRYGVMDISTLRTPHCEKRIHTAVWFPQQISDLFTQVRQTIAKQGQVIVVYPRREEGDDTQESTGGPLPSVEEAYSAWERCFPGRVRFIHSTLDSEAKTQALEDMKARRADVILCTTILEIGINLPHARRVVVVHPERYGLSTLHQLRGRVARTGGEGWFDLFLPVPVKDHTLERLHVLETTQDGFKVAEADMHMRGVGDLGARSNLQSGCDETFLYGRGVSVEILDQVMAELPNLCSSDSWPSAE